MALLLELASKETIETAIVGVELRAAAAAHEAGKYVEWIETFGFMLVAKR